MKKATSKSTAKTPAPAKKAIVKSAAKPAAPVVKPVKPAAVPKVKVVAPLIATAPVSPARVVPPVPATKEAPVSATPVTVISAQIDIGFGNALYLRGEGPGLSWEKGVPLENVSADTWSFTLSETTKPIIFKFLINDLTWSGGGDYVVAPGSSVVLTPTF